MLLTLYARNLACLAAQPGKPDLFALPEFARSILRMHGLNLSTALLAGTSRPKLESFRERADRARCSCLLLLEERPLPMGDSDDSKATAAVERARRVLQAAQVLGCNAAGIAISGHDDDNTLQRTIDRLKRTLASADRLELNLLIWPSPGLTTSPDRITEIIKKVGGFRVGTLPDFQVAAATKDPIAFMRRLTPYAGVVIASAGHPTPKGSKKAKAEPPPEYDLATMVKAVQSVGYEGTLAVDYRGDGDVKLGIEQTRDALEAILGLPESDTA